MKILIVASLYYPHVGGIETVITEISSIYKKKGIDVAVLTKKWPIDLQDKDIYQGVPIYRVKSAKNDDDFFETLDQIKSIQHLIKSDIVHVIGARRPLPLFGLLLGRMWNVPVIVSIAGSEVPHPDDSATQLIWQSGLDIIPDTIRQSDKLTVFSKDLGKVVESVLPNQQYEVLYAGLDLSIFKDAKIIKNQKPYILSLRRLIRSKGIDILIKAFSKIEKQFPKLNLYIAGDGEERENLEKLANSLGLKDKIKFLGTVDIKKAAVLLKNAELTVVPSRSEGGGLVNIEAQASGCPLVASNIGGIPEYVKKDITGLLFKSENVNDLAQSIRNILTNPELRNRLISQGKKFADKFSWDILIDEYIDLYKKTTSQKSKDFIPWSNLTKKLWEEVEMEKIAYKLIKQYDIPLNTPLELIRETDYNAVFLVHDLNKKILRISKKIDLNEINFELDAIRHLQKNKIPTAGWVANKKGVGISVENKYYGVLFEYISGNHALIDKDHYPSNNEVFQAGEMLGRFHNTSKDFQTKNPKTRTIYSELEKIVQNQEKFKKYYLKADIFINEAIEMIDFAKSANAEEGLIQNDFRPHNVFFEKDKIKALIDFDWSCKGPIIKDLALGLVEWSFPDGGEPNQQLFNKFLEGYNSTQENKIKIDKCLYQWIMFNCLSDAATYLYNKIEPGETNNPIRSFMYNKYKYYKGELIK